VSVKKRSMCDGFSLLRRGVNVLLLGLASFGATSRPLSRLGRWSGLGFPGGDCILGDIGRTRRSSAAIDSRVGAFVGRGDFGNDLIVGELLVQKSRGDNAPIRIRREIWKREMTDSRLRSSSVSWRFGRGG